MKQDELILLIAKNEKMERRNFWLGITGIVLACLALVPQAISLLQAREANAIATTSVSASQSGNTIAEKSNTIQEKGVTTAEKGLDVENSKNLRDMVAKLATNRIYVCGSSLRTSTTDIKSYCEDSRNKPSILQVQEWLSGLVMVGTYLAQGVQQKDILPIFSREMLMSLCESREISDLARYNDEQSSAIDMACAIR